ncbi:hypothetical protein V8F20_005091 [Naviculisporaceae sp. PSN 640]
MPPLSRTSSTTSITKPDPVALEFELDSRLSHYDIPQTTFARHHRIPRPAKTHLKGHFTRQTHPPRAYNRYILVRSISVVVCLLQIILVAIAASGSISKAGYTNPLPPDDDNPTGDPQRKLKHWLDPCLSPAISALCWTATDVLGVWKWQRRAHHIARGVYDAIIAVGFCIAGGFFVYMARGVLTGRDRENGWGNSSEMAVGGGIVVCMIAEVILHSIVACEGITDMIETRRAVKSNWGVAHEA